MGHDRGRNAHDVRARGALVVLAAVTAALMIHLFGPALHPSTASESTDHGHQRLALIDAHLADAEDQFGVGDNIRAAAHDEETCHSVVGMAPATTVAPMAACFAVTWRSAFPAQHVRHVIGSAAMGGDGGDASLDPQRSPGVQRT